MEIKETSWSNWEILDISGDFVLKNLVLIRDRFDAIERSGKKSAALDLTRLNYIDSSGVACILNFHRRLIAVNGKLVIFGADRDVYEVFSIVGLDKTIPLYSSIEDFKKSEAQA
jgi:anti-anti-sigma factor